MLTTSSWDAEMLRIFSKNFGFPKPPREIHISFTPGPQHRLVLKNRRKEERMRRWMWIGVSLLVILGGILIGVGAYHAGVTHGLEQTGRAVEVVRVGPRDGYFPFGLFLFPLFFIGLFLLIRGAFWSRRWAGWDAHHHENPWGHGPWGHGGSQAFEEWHRHQHEHHAADHPGS